MRQAAWIDSITAVPRQSFLPTSSTIPLRMLVLIDARLFKFHLSRQCAFLFCTFMSCLHYEHAYKTVKDSLDKQSAFFIPNKTDCFAFIFICLIYCSVKKFVFLISTLGFWGFGVCLKVCFGMNIREINL